MKALGLLLALLACTVDSLVSLGLNKEYIYICVYEKEYSLM